MSRSSEDQGQIKLNYFLSIVNIFCFCDLCATWMVTFNLKAFLFYIQMAVKVHFKRVVPLPY